MEQIKMNVDLTKLPKGSNDRKIIEEVEAIRKTAFDLAAENRNIDALERTVAALKALREFSSFEDTEFQATLIALLFDLAEVHFLLKDYRQAEKEIEVLFRMIEKLIKIDAERFGEYHILAMDLSTRVLRSRKKAMDLLVKQQINAGQLYEKVNSGVVAATDKLVDSLRNVAQLLASTGNYRGAMKFYAEAIKLSKRRAGRVTEKEVTMTIEMAKIMNRISNMRPRAVRLLNVIIPHAISLGAIQLEEDALALLEIIGTQNSDESSWKNLLRKITFTRKPKNSEEAKKED